jgi:hypothetical protein
VIVAQRRIDRRPDAVRIAQDLVIPKTNDAITFALEDCGPGRIDLRFVLPTIDLDNDFRSMACKVRDEVPDRNLASEMMLAECLSQYMPEALFGGGRIEPHEPRAGDGP